VDTRHKAGQDADGVGLTPYFSLCAFAGMTICPIPTKYPYRSARR
jgi:hypothetical protein